MQTCHIPATGPRYWTAISIASVFGANLGDFVSHGLHLGHMRGLPVLAFVLAAVLLGERRVRAGGEAWYWLAIVTLRTAATNLADLATHDLKLGYANVIVGLAMLLAAMLLLDPTGRRALIDPARTALPRTNGWYWTAMLIAGTLGTALGDAVANAPGLGVGRASILLGLVVAAVLGLRTRAGFVTGATYWLAIVAIRTAGTTVGDLSADACGLAVSTTLTGLLLAVTLLAWNLTPSAAPAKALEFSANPGHTVQDRASSRDAGFTLLEILVVIAILGLLIGLVAPAALRQLGGARVSVARQSIERLGAVLDLYRLDVGSYPNSEQGLQALVTRPTNASNWSGPYVQNGQLPVDPWTHPYLYREPATRSGHEYDLCSRGPNAAAGDAAGDSLICNP